MDRKYVVIDIGFNVVCLLIGEILFEDGYFYLKKIFYMWLLLWFGEDVFFGGIIIEKKMLDFIKIIKVFGLIFEIFQVEVFWVCVIFVMWDV